MNATTPQCFLTNEPVQSWETWHKRFGHIGVQWFIARVKSCQSSWIKMLETNLEALRNSTSFPTIVNVIMMSVPRAGVEVNVLQLIHSPIRHTKTN